MANKKTLTIRVLEELKERIETLAARPCRQWARQAARWRAPPQPAAESSVMRPRVGTLSASRCDGVPRCTA